VALYTKPPEVAPLKVQFMSFRVVGVGHPAPFERQMPVEATVAVEKEAVMAYSVVPEAVV
jgi:hypothetical protein